MGTLDAALMTQANAEVLGFGEAPERQAQRRMRAAEKYDAGVVFGEAEAVHISRACTHSRGQEAHGLSGKDRTRLGERRLIFVPQGFALLK